MKIKQNFNFRNLNKEIVFNENQFVIDYIKDLNLVIINSKIKQFSGIKALDLLDNNLNFFNTKPISRYNPYFADINSIFHTGGNYRKLVHSLINLYLFENSTFDIISNTYINKNNALEIFKENKLISLIMNEFIINKPKSEQDFYSIIYTIEKILILIHEIFYLFDISYLYKADYFFDILIEFKKILYSELTTNNKIYNILKYFKLDVDKELENSQKFSKLKSYVLKVLNSTINVDYYG